MNKICILTNKYPNKFDPNVLMFVQQFAWSMADLGWECTIIAPSPINLRPQMITLPLSDIEITDRGNTVQVFRPKYIGFGQTEVFGFNPAKLTTKSFTRSCKKVIDRFKIPLESLYGHFITPAGISAARLGKIFNVPSFLAFGESTDKTIVNFGKESVSKELETLTGVISVSGRNKNLLVNSISINEDLISVFPNGYRPERFSAKDKLESRIKYRLPKDKFIVCFVGSFDDRKGILRLEEAIDAIDDVYFICAGKGQLNPSSDKCLFAGPVDNVDLPFFYSAADVFVLPTLNEGCCNAIIEAMACGLPIISSKDSFNDELLDESNSLRVNPLSVTEIIEAIQSLKHNEAQRKLLSKGALEKSLELTLESRATNIAKYIVERTSWYDEK